MKQGVFDKVILFVLFNNIKAELCEDYSLAGIDTPVVCDNPYANECCQMNNRWYCVYDFTDYNCEAVGQGSRTVLSTNRPTGSKTTTTSNRPTGSSTITNAYRATRGVSSTSQRYFTYRPFTASPKQTTYDYIAPYFPNTSKPSQRFMTDVSILAAIGAVIVLVVIITFIVMKHSKRRDQQRRNALFNAVNEQISRNSGQHRGNPVYTVGVRETETQVNWTHNNVNDSLANNEHIAQGFMLNVQPPPYSQCIASDQSSKQLSSPTDSADQPSNS